MNEYFEIAKEGFFDAKAGEPLFGDDHPAYHTGWCIFHGCAYPYPSVSESESSENDKS